MFTISPVTADQIANLEAALKSHGTALTETAPNEYEVNGHGVVAAAVFDPVAASLTVTIQHKPFYITESAIQGGLESALKG
jgi:hypothetical protein